MRESTSHVPWIPAFAGMTKWLAGTAHGYRGNDGVVVLTYGYRGSDGAAYS
jgi:hypothetical protein